MNYAETVSYLYSCLPDYQQIGVGALNNKLDKIKLFCDWLGNPETKFKSIHIAGTNGKGSSSHMLAAILQASGYKTGLYTSPHLKSFTERIRINGAEITEEFVVDFVERCKPFIDERKPSFFEMTVAMCFDYFAQSNIDIAVVEVGLGGRLDATNVIIPEVALITNISYDHTGILGKTLPLIAAEKAGIIKYQIPTIVSEFQYEISEVFEKIVQRLDSKLVFADKEVSIKDLGLQDHYREIEIEGMKYQCGLLGAYQLKNLAGVYSVISVLKKSGWQISQIGLLKGLKEVVTLTGLKGRWQILHQNPVVVCDTAHNESGIKEVIAQINSYEYEKLHIVAGFAADKEIVNILKLFPSNAQFYFCGSVSPRILDVEKLKEAAVLAEITGEAYLNVNDAMAAAKIHADPNDLIYVGGSNFIVAEIDDL